MTPLLPSPKHYLHNLITMTSSDSKSSGEELLKSTSIVHVFIAEKLMILKNLHSIMSNLVQKVVKTLREMLFARAGNAMRTKVVVIGLDGCERHLDSSHFEN